MPSPRGSTFGIVTACVVGAVPAIAATIRVPEDQPSLTAAVAEARAGDEIVIGPGRYSAAVSGESFPIRLRGKSLLIRGAGADRTILDGEDRTRLFWIGDGDRSRISDLRLERGHAPDGGGAIRIDAGEPGLLRLVLTGSRSRTEGDVVLVRDGRPRFVNCVFAQNGGAGPTISVAEGAPSFFRCTWWANGGSAIEVRGGAAVRAERCVIARPGNPEGPSIGLRIVATAEAGLPTFADNVFLECEDGVVRVEGDAGRALADALEEARRLRGLRSRPGTLRNPERGDFRLHADVARDEDHGAYGGETPLPPPRENELAGASPAPPDSTSLLGPGTPNPFAPPTTIHFHVPEPSFVDLGIYNVLGQRVRSLPAGDLGAGDHHREWDGRDDRGEDLPPGIYFVRITIGALMESRRLVLVR